MKEHAAAQAEDAPTCPSDGATCSPSHRAARRISTALIVFLSTAIVALTMWNHLIH